MQYFQDESNTENKIIVSITYQFPQKGYSTFNQKKPLASLLITLDNSEADIIKVPVQVAQFFKKDNIEVPISYVSFLEILHQQELSCCKQKIEQMLNKRDYTVFEISQKFKLAGYQPDVSEQIINWACKQNFLNDERYAQTFIESKKRCGWGRYKIETSLRNKGIRLDTFDGYPNAYFNEGEEFEHAYTLIEKKSIPHQHPFQKLSRFLVSKGFSPSISSEVVKMYLDNSEQKCDEQIY